jgi:hypothetical protein
MRPGRTINSTSQGSTFVSARIAYTLVAKGRASRVRPFGTVAKTTSTVCRLSVPLLAFVLLGLGPLMIVLAWVVKYAAETRKRSLQR